MGNLTEKQKMFCREYLIDLNGAQAAIRAGYSENSAKEIASEILTKPNVQEHLQSLMDERTEKVELTAENILNDIILTRKAAADDGKHGDRLRANELLGKHMKLFTDKIEHSGNVLLESVLNDINGKSADLPED